MKTLLALPLLLAASLFFAAGAAATSAHNVFVSNGFDGDQVKPQGQTLLGPFTIALFDLDWNSWGGKRAVATGEWARRPCSVGCDGEPFTDYSPVRVVLSKKRECPRGSDRFYYMKRTITFTGRVPNGVKRRQTSKFLCWEELSPTPLISTKPIEPHGMGGRVAEVSTGWDHACAVRTSGALWCWGGNENDWEPFRVRGLDEGVSAVSAGEFYTCAVTTAGGAKCWGYNSDGQLGDGTHKRSKQPVDVIGLTSGVQAITTGRDSACALTSAGGVKCWGSNFFGNLGDGTTRSRTGPVDVEGLESGVVAVSAGNLATCALTYTGAVKCWGFLADNVDYGSEPVDVPGLASGVTAVSVGEGHACALTAEGGVKCWGWNGDGELGKRGDHSAAPVDVAGLASGVTSIDAGYWHTCVTVDDGAARCWGYNITGELGTTRIESSAKPLAISGLGGITDLSAGHIFSCVVTTASGVKCWGNNENGELGIGSGRDR